MTRKQPSVSKVDRSVVTRRAHSQEAAIEDVGVAARPHPSQGRSPSSAGSAAWDDYEAQVDHRPPLGDRCKRQHNGGDSHGEATPHQCPSRQGGIQGPAGRADELEVQDRRGVGAVPASTEAREAMTFDGAIVREQGITFGTMVVKPPVLDDASRRDVVARR